MISPSWRRTGGVGKVYNVLGQVVATLADEVMPAGAHHVAWRAGDHLSSGLYYVSVSWNGHRQTRKLTLLR